MTKRERVGLIELYRWENRVRGLQNVINFCLGAVGFAVIRKRVVRSVVPMIVAPSQGIANMARPSLGEQRYRVRKRSFLSGR